MTTTFLFLLTAAADALLAPLLLQPVVRCCVNGSRPERRGRIDTDTSTSDPRALQKWAASTQRAPRSHDFDPLRKPCRVAKVDVIRLRMSSSKL